MRDDHLRAYKYKNTAKGMGEIMEALFCICEKKVQRPKSENGERITRNDQERFTTHGEYRRHTVNCTHDVGRFDHHKGR